MLRCSVESHKMSASHSGKKTEIKFELEVCLLSRLEMLGGCDCFCNCQNPHHNYNVLWLIEHGHNNYIHFRIILEYS